MGHRVQAWALLLALLVAATAWSRADDDQGPPAITALPPHGSIRLFNGHDLDGLTFYSQLPAEDFARLWHAHDDILSIKDGVTGYLRTKKSYTNYNLHVEYRWPGKVGATGVLLNVRGPDAATPYSLRISAEPGGAGDLIPQGGFAFGGSHEPIKRSGKSNDQPPGAWNSFDVFCRSDMIAVYANGVLQSQGKKPSADTGQIALQLEGTAIEFRNVWLEEFSE